MMPIDAIDALNCLPRTMIESRLERQFGEYAMLEGNKEQARVTIYINPKSYSFTILVILPSGEACWLIAGKDLRPIPQAADLPKKGERAP